MKVKTTDQLHISSVGADTIPGGSVVDVPDTAAKQLIERGLATAVAGSKAAPSPKNKAAPKAKNKSK